MLPRGTPIGPVIELQIRRALETWEGGAPVATAFIIAVELHAIAIIQMRYTMSPQIGVLALASHTALLGHVLADQWTPSGS